ncbi:hypothetical protein ABE10_02425, partial [Bacillus toyonensis]|nr:hypothetical protein [Bacillus toyonensis]
MPGEVPPYPFEERVLADEGDELLEHRGALGVGDAVEVELRRLKIRDVGDDRMGGRKLVLRVGPRLATVGEGHPGIGEPGRCDGGVRAHVVGERLLEPEVVPPSHRHQVSEPHVRHLVQYRVRTRLVLRSRRGAAEDVGLGEGDQPRVLHRSEVVLGHEDLVVLPPRVGIGERVREEVEPLSRDLDDPVRIQVLGERGAAEDAERHHEVATTPFLVHPMVWTGRDTGDVAGDRERGSELDPLHALLLDGGHGALVGQHPPSPRRADDERIGSLHVGLLEAGHDPAGVCRLILGVQVGRAVDRVEEPVQALAGAAVLSHRLDEDDVPVGEPVEKDPSAVPPHLLLNTVHDHAPHALAQEVQPGVVRGRRELQRGRGGEATAPLIRCSAQVELDAD